MPPAKKAAPAAKPATSKPDPAKPTELEAWQAAERGEHHPPPVEGVEPGVHRAGGYVDRGDGRGWELEE